jgi:hypothetical protein
MQLDDVNYLKQTSMHEPTAANGSHTSTDREFRSKQDCPERPWVSSSSVQIDLSEESKSVNKGIHIWFELMWVSA